VGRVDDDALTPVADRARTLFVNGRILGPGLTPVGQAMLVGDSFVLWVGSAADARVHRDAAPAVVDLEGRVVTAAFVDAHVHLSATGAALRGLDLSDVRSLHEALSRVESAARRAGGRPLLAQNWDETGWPEQRPFTARELDRASYGGVVYAPRVDGHSAIVSSALAAAARLDPTGMPDGRVVTDEHHRARAAFHANVTRDERREDIALALRTAAARGVAHLHENGGPVVSSVDDAVDVNAVAADDAMPRVTELWAELVSTEAEAGGITRSLRGRRLAGDLNIDGSIGSRTARLRAGYTDAPDTHGEAFLTVEQVRDHVVACTRTFRQAGFHVIGDAGVDTAIAGFEAAAEVDGLANVRLARHRLEHVEMIDPDGARRLARLGVTASVQPAFDARWGGPTGMYATRLGADRAHRMNPLRTLLDAGVTLALGSDSPVTPIAPWEAVRACVRHHDEQERITAAEAFAAHTAGGHRATGDTAEQGPLRAGGPVDYVVWDDVGGWFDAGGILREEAMELPPPVATRTVCAGNVIHDTLG